MEKVKENQCYFLKSSTALKNLPNESVNEFCFWGRSNVGKSSLLNSITKSKLAKTSKTPGRTTTLNFFECKDKYRLVDLPGYGYAKRSKQDIYRWNELIIDYLDNRKKIASIFLLIDSRHGIKKIDQEAIELIETFKNHFFIVLTKIDKIKKKELENCYKKLNNLIKSLFSVDQRIFSTSSRKNMGIKEITKVILEMS